MSISKSHRTCVHAFLLSWGKGFWMEIHVWFHQGPPNFDRGEQREGDPLPFQMLEMRDLAASFCTPKPHKRKSMVLVLLASLQTHPKRGAAKKGHPFVKYPAKSVTFSQGSMNHYVKGWFCRLPLGSINKEFVYGEGRRTFTWSRVVKK